MSNVSVLNENNTYTTYFVFLCFSLLMQVITIDSVKTSTNILRRIYLMFIKEIQFPLIVMF